MVAETRAPDCSAMNRHAVSPLLLLAATSHVPPIDGTSAPGGAGTAAAAGAARKAYGVPLARRYSPVSWPSARDARSVDPSCANAKVTVRSAISPAVEVTRRSPLKNDPRIAAPS